MHILKSQESAVSVVFLPHNINQLKSTESIDQLFDSKYDQYVKSKVIALSEGEVSQLSVLKDDHVERVITVAIGHVKDFKVSVLQRAIQYLVAFLQKNNITEIEFYIDDHIKSLPQFHKHLAISLLRHSYHFDHYGYKEKPLFQLNVSFQQPLSNDEQSEFSVGLSYGKGIEHARNLANIPPNILTPDYLVQDANHMADDDTTVNIYQGQSLEDLGAGLILAVGQGSIYEPALISIDYNPTGEDEAPIVLVGKGITYDSGGYSIKSKTGMPTMKYDMCGAANVLGMMKAIKQLKPNKRIIAVVGASENMVNAHAMKPDDVFISMQGDSVEVTNTDAEGRLVLADSVFYASQYRPKCILDFATLTGASVMALGNDKAAVMTNSMNKSVQSIIEQANLYHQTAWQMPITDEDRKKVRDSDVADVVNNTNTPGKALFAAAFIEHFTESYPWMHFDIAGPAVFDKDSHLGPKGPTGFLIEPVLDFILE